MTVLLDIGSGNTLKNWETAEELLEQIELFRSYTKHEVFIKTQLFKNVSPNKPLDRPLFSKIVEWAKRKKIPIGTSVFDRESLSFAQKREIDFIKIANRPDLYWLASYTNLPLYISISPDLASLFCTRNEYRTYPLVCVSKYPAQAEDYWFLDIEMGVSDHTVGIGFFREHENIIPIWEKHIVLKRDPDNPDAGMWALTPDMLKELG